MSLKNNIFFLFKYKIITNLEYVTNYIYIFINLEKTKLHLHFLFFFILHR